MVHYTEEPIEKIDQEELNQVLSKVDKESTHRHFVGLLKILIAVIAISFSLFQLYTASFGLLPAQLQRAIHLGFVLLLGFLLYPASIFHDRKKLHWYDIILALIGFGITLYLVFNYEALIARAGAFTTIDVIFGIAGILLVLELCRRVVGLPIVIIAAVAIFYAMLGKYMPGFLNHRGYSIERIVSHLMYTTEGVLGIPLGVCATYIFLFILFGIFLEKTGIGKFFIEIADSIAGFASGGPAKVAVITSALEGTVSGSSVSNTVGSGSFTIPMMKKLGYKPEFAAAVEAAASTGGQIMPPVMGAAAFLMAESLGMPYIEVAKAAIIPALLYFSGIFIMVHLEAKKLGLKGLPKEKIPKILNVLAERGHLIIPLITIIYFLIEGTTPIRAALYGIIASIIASLLRKKTRINFRDIINALEAGGRNIIGVASACAVAGIIVGIVTLTGLGLKMGNGLLSLVSGNLFLTLLFTMISSLILGMGVPTTANYLITSTITAPAVVGLGVNKLAAHMFAFYFGIIADITPPVALAAYAGSAIAKSNPFKTGLTATKLAIGAFIVPYIFVLSPQLLLIDATLLNIIQIIITSIIGMVGVSIAMEGFLIIKTTIFERIGFMIAGLLLIDPGIYTDLIGIGIFIILIIIHFIRKKRIRVN